MRIDANSETWRAVLAWADAERMPLEAQLRDPRTDHSATQVIRGRLQELDALVALPVPRKAIKEPAVVGYET